SSAFSSSTRASASRSSERSPGVVSSHPGKAAFAASTAASTSSAEHRGTTPSTSSVAGFSTSMVSPEAACTQLPPTRIPWAAAIPATLAHDHRSLHVIVDGADVVVRTGLGELELVPLDQGWPERVREDPRVVEPLAVPARRGHHLEVDPLRPASLGRWRLAGPARWSDGVRVDVDGSVRCHEADVVVRLVRVDRDRVRAEEPPGPRPTDGDLDGARAELADAARAIRNTRAGQFRVRAARERDVRHRRLALP